MFGRKKSLWESTPAAGPEAVAKGNIEAMQNSLRYQAVITFKNGTSRTFEDTGKNNKLDIAAAESEAGPAIEARIVGVMPDAPVPKNKDVLQMPGNETIH